MIIEWERTEDCWMNIGSPDIVQWQQSRGYLETPRHESSPFKGVKKNSMWTLRGSASKLLRQEETAHTGFVVWGCTDISGSGGASGQMQGVRKSEAGGAEVACEESLLYETICVLCREKVSQYDGEGCSKGVEAGLAHRKVIREGIYAGTASPESCSSP